MIPKPYIDEWKTNAPWADDTMVEQDLIISRILIGLFENVYLKEKLAFRGGTALNKLFLENASRYSEDIDLVQLNAEPIGKLLGKIKTIVNPILGKPKWKLNSGRATLLYKYTPESTEVIDSGKLEIEINTREHFSIFGTEDFIHSMENRWYSGKANIRTYTLEELMGTKLRALYQRKKGRDLFDVWYVLSNKMVDIEKMVYAFMKYMEFENNKISRAMFEENLAEKLNSSVFTDDISVLLSPKLNWQQSEAIYLLQNEILPLLPGKPWKDEENPF